MFNPWRKPKVEESAPIVEFVCDTLDLGVIPPPIRSGKVIPAWYRNLAGKVNNVDIIENSTIKRCPPVIEAMTEGWIMPLAADVEFKTNADASGVEYRSLFYKPMIENHQLDQIKGHPDLPKPPMKFMNYWMVKVPPGYNLLFMPPLNRPDPRFTCFSGIVRGEYMEYINFPFFFNIKNFTGVIEAGTPLVQLMIYKRDDAVDKCSVKAFSNSDVAEIELTRRKRKSHPSTYRDSIWKQANV
jgi:hypothetical protein